MMSHPYRISGLFYLLTWLYPMCVWADPFVIQGDVFSFKPRLWVSNLYDDNVFYEAPQEPTRSVPNTGYLIKVGSGFNIENRQKNTVDFKLNAQGAYRNYWSIDDENGRLSQQTLESRNGLDYLRGNGSLVLGTQNRLQVHLNSQASYIERPIYENTLFGFERLDYRVGGALHFVSGRTGQGPLRFQLGYAFRQVQFLNDQLNGADERDDVAIIDRSKKDNHIIKLVTQWRFLPKNFLTFDVNFQQNDYNDLEIRNINTGETTQIVRDSRPLRVQLGLMGLLSKRISVFLKGGYANTFNESGSTFSGLIGLFQISYLYEPFLRMSIGYQRDGQDSGFSNFYTLNRYFYKMNWSLTKRLFLRANISLDEYTYDASNSIDNQGRYDPVLRASVQFGSRFIGATRVRLGWTIESNYTDYYLPISVPRSDALDFAQYQRNLFNLSFDFN